MKYLFLILITCYCCVSCSNSEQKNKTAKPPASAIRQQKQASDISYPKETGLFHDTIYAHSDGKLEWLTTKHHQIRKNTHLFTINNSKAYLKLYNDKARFKFILDSLIDYCPADIQMIKPKWQKFDDQLRFDTLTPRFPQIEYKEEADYFATKELVDSYNKMLMQEKKMKNNFEFAKRDYTSVKWQVKAGQKVKKGQVVGITTN